MEAFLFAVGGILYTRIEILWRGHTHWTMFVLGGTCFVVLGLLNEHQISWDWCLLWQSVVGAWIVTMFEFFAGCIVNLWLRWNVWDYSDLPFNILGQICFYYFLLWILLSMIGIVFDDWIRYFAYLALYKIFPQMKERQKPHYRFL